MKATIVLDRTSGAILKMSGQISSIGTTATRVNGLGPPPVPSSSQPAGSFGIDTGAGQVDETQGARELAALVWNFTSTAGSLVQEIDTEVRTYGDSSRAPALTAWETRPLLTLSPSPT